MEKSYIEWNGKQYPIREVWIEYLCEGYGSGMVADVELWNAIESEVENDNEDAVAIDNQIYFYCDSCFIASNPADAEILWAVCKGTEDEKDIDDQTYYNLMRQAELDIAKRYESGKTTMNCECYEMSGEYTAYFTENGAMRHLYNGISARECFFAMLAVDATQNLIYKDWE